MDLTIPGIHHVTAITADGQKNVDFYCGVLGLRLVKLTVNFDDPLSYHLYYGDELGRPGTIMTFFVWLGATRGRVGAPQVTATAFAAPPSSLEFWSRRLEENGAQPEAITLRFGQSVLPFSDPDGMQLEIVAMDPLPTPTPMPTATSGEIPSEYALCGFHGVTISEEGHEETAKLLNAEMGFALIGSELNRFRYRAAGGGFASTVDLLCVPGGRQGKGGAGVVHHVAFRTPTDEQQAGWREKIAGLGLNVSPVMERTYFRSIYYREPGGVLFEIATEKPGFTVDQPASELGARLMLPPWLESHRGELERRLRPLRIPLRRQGVP
jgi:glyoxalase family protein